jgi:hypothetical protein
MYGLLYECKFLTIEEKNKKKKKKEMIHGSHSLYVNLVWEKIVF